MRVFEFAFKKKGGGFTKKQRFFKALFFKNLFGGEGLADEAAAHHKAFCVKYDRLAGCRRSNRRFKVKGKAVFFTSGNGAGRALCRRADLR